MTMAPRVVMFDENRTRLLDDCQTVSEMWHSVATDDIKMSVDVADITTLLHALGDPVRLELIRALAASEEPICCGGFHVGVTKSTLSHHFRVLREAGVISQTCEGVRKLTTLRRRDVDAAFPGLLASILRASEPGSQPS